MVCGRPKWGKTSPPAEPCDGAEAVALEREHEHRVRTRDAALAFRQVARERRLGVRARLHHPQRRAAARVRAAQEGADRGPALVGVGEGRHREPRVGGQERHQSVEVAVFDRRGEAADDVALALGVRQRRPVASGGRQPRFERLPRAAQQAVDRRRAGLEHLGDLGGAVAEHVAQDEHRTLLRREVLQADDEGQCDRLPGLVASLGAGSRVGDPLEEHVGIGLEPDRLVPARRLGQRARRPLVGAAPARPQGIERAVRRDPVEPRTHRRAPLEPPEAAPRREQRLLEQVLGVLGRADDPVDVQLELTLVGAGQLAERVLVARAGTGEGRLGHARILPEALSVRRHHT